MRTFFWHFIHMKVCFDLSLIRFLIQFLKIFHCIQAHYQIPLYQYCLLYPKCHHILIAILHFFSKGLYILNFLKISSICTLFWKHCTQGNNFFIIIFLPNRIFKTFLPKKNLVRYCYSILKLRFCVGEICVFRLQYLKTL